MQEVPVQTSHRPSSITQPSPAQPPIRPSSEPSLATPSGVLGVPRDALLAPGPVQLLLLHDPLDVDLAGRLLAALLTRVVALALLLVRDLGRRLVGRAVVEPERGGQGHALVGLAGEQYKVELLLLGRVGL